MVRSRRFDRKKFDLIIFYRSFWSHCLVVNPTVWPNSCDDLTVVIKNYLRSSDQSLTCQNTADHLRLLFPWTQVLPLAWFCIRFFTRSSDQSGNGTPTEAKHLQTLWKHSSQAARSVGGNLGFFLRLVKPTTSKYVIMASTWGSALRTQSTLPGLYYVIRLGIMSLDHSLAFSCGSTV